MNFLFSRAFALLCICSFGIGSLNAQTVAIIDQGYNSDLTHRGASKFVHQNCISYADGWGLMDNPNPNEDQEKIEFWTATLCPNQKRTDYYRNISAKHPRAIVPLPTSNGTALYVTTNKLKHGRAVSNALWDFDNTISQSLFQVYGFNGNADVNGDGYGDHLIFTVNGSSGYTNYEETIADPKRYKTKSGQNIADALTVLSLNPPSDLYAVSISTVIGNSLVTPSICRSGLGQAAVLRLKANGIAVVAGLKNTEIVTGAATWPNCLRFVINVGNTNTVGNPNEIGLGGNNIDFYMDSLTSIPGESIPDQGNSLVAPKIAGAFALLGKEFPNSSLEQRYQALVKANNNYYTYKSVSRRKVRRSDIEDALTELDIFYNGGVRDIDDGILTDESIYGQAYGGSATDEVELQLNFSDLLNEVPVTSEAEQSTIAFKSISVPSERDVTLEITGLFDEIYAARRKFKIIVNNTQVLKTEAFLNNTDETKKYVINRDYFSAETNIIKIEPTVSSAKWGLKNINIRLLPVIPLELGLLNEGEYGSFGDPTRFTGARFSFEHDFATPNQFGQNLALSMRGYDIDSDDETEVFLNNTSLGFLSKTGNNSYGDLSKFLLNHSLMVDGANTIELVQKKPLSGIGSEEDQKWAVKDILIELSSPMILAPVFMLLLDDESN